MALQYEVASCIFARCEVCVENVQRRRVSGESGETLKLTLHQCARSHDREAPRPDSEERVPKHFEHI